MKKAELIKTITAGAFNEDCLAIVDEVQAKRESVLITKHGKPVVKLVPVDTGKDDIYNFLGGKGVILGDVVTPVLPLVEWNWSK